MTKNSKCTKRLGIFSPALLVICLMLWPVPGAAEFYRYYDENGMLRFTDNIAVVPEDQRSRIKSYDEENDYLTPEEQAAKARDERRLEQLEIHDMKTTAIQKADTKTHNGLEGVRKELNEDLKALEDRRKALESEQGSWTTWDEYVTYKEKRRALNEDIDLYEQRREDFVKKAKAYNTLSE